MTMLGHCEMDLKRRMEERNYVIYRISNALDDDTYIGCTSKLLKYRLSEHVSRSTRTNSKLSIKIRGVGAENLMIVDLYTRWMTQVDAQKVEGGLIDLLEPTLNSQSSGKYYDNEGNYDKVSNMREYYFKNEEHLKEYGREYGREYRVRNKDKRSKKTTCECGGSYTYPNKAVHQRIQRHLSNVSVFSSPPCSPPHSTIPLPIIDPEDSACHSA